MSITREQLELVVQKKKINEVYNWFHDHFISSSQQAYATKCPFVIIQGPAGCGKTTTLKCVAKELRIPIKEYSDTTDTTAISYEMNHDKDRIDEDRSLDRRKASRFEHFVFNNLRFNPLDTPADVTQTQQLARADSEFDDSDDDQLTQFAKPQPVVSGIIIHIESPLLFARSQKIFVSSIAKMIKMIREISRSNPRRIAIVFETLESDKDVISLPTKFKQTIGMQVLKFNPIIRANMKKFIESLLRKYQNVIIDKDTIDTLITDCDGDLQACINTIEIIRNKSHNYNNVYMGLNDENSISPSIFQVNKKQRLNPERFKLNTGLMRDVTRSLGFFHTLGKIFYQKRLYPETRNHCYTNEIHRNIDRPFPTENTTEYLVNRLDSEPKKLLPWLHQHYYKFCHESNIEKASLFLEHLSDIDTISMNSMQSSQFYEVHSAIDQIQLHLAVESTVFSLYTDQSKVTKPSHKKTTNNRGSHIIKSSVENFTQNGNGELLSFSKPASISVPKVTDDHQMILEYCLEEINEKSFNCVDSSKILVDYIPYLRVISGNWNELARKSQPDSLSIPKICNDKEVLRMMQTLEQLQLEPTMDYDAKHESLSEILEEIESRKIKKVINSK
jgi:DNA polymerase III delta prime subunit